ncbi:hypothetical protein [Alteribacillus sp. HJP-4]|uniref:hypothetical protein n=1 Tax=Alteribacillus sp. HJP-4 TaxID=2775394 RepID=UPI0035CCD434
MRLLNNKKVISGLSLIAVIILTLLDYNPTNVSPGELEIFHLGFPTDWLRFNSEFRGFSFNFIGLAVNFCLFYFIFWIIGKMTIKSTKYKKELNS